jgi:hypothetical protein
MTKTTLKSAGIGLLSGALAFALLSLAHAQQTVTVRDIHQNAKNFVGHEVTVTGLAGPVRHETKKGEEWVSFGIQEQDARGKKTGYNIWVHLPVSAFNGTVPTENSNVSVTGTVNWPWTIARMGD